MRIGAYGEVMLRLTPPEYLMLEQTNTLRMSYTGTGVNLVGNLARFGVETYLMTALPNNRLGNAAIAHLKSLGIHTAHTIQQMQHIGTYFAEMGYGIRPTEVTYQNRLNSSFSLSNIKDFPIDAFLQAVDIIHICGISLSLTDETAHTAIELARRAQEEGKEVCFDFNFRPALNQTDGKKEVMKARYEEILPYCTILFGSKRDLVELMEWTGSGEENVEEDILIQSFMKYYEIKWFAGTRRQKNHQEKMLSGYLWTQTGKAVTMPQSVDILDRIGTGDAYAAGILLGFTENWTIEETVAFAVANARLAHTTHGDTPLTTRKQVYQLLDDPDIDLIR
ncbi:MAG: sugar kinase [Enterococcus sp.]